MLYPDDDTGLVGGIEGVCFGSADTWGYTIHGACTREARKGPEWQELKNQSPGHP